MSFLEVIVVTSLLALVVGALVPVLTTGQQTWNHAHRRTDMVQNARIAMDHMLIRLRAVQSFQSIGPSAIRFTYFLGDGVSTQTVDYQLNGITNELEYRIDPGPFLPLAGPFTFMTLVCYDVANVAISCAGLSSVKSIEVSLKATDPSGEVSDIGVSGRAYRQVP